MMHKAWSSIEEVPYCFSRSSVKFQGHIALKIVEFDLNWAFPDCNSSLNSPMAMKCCTNFETAKKRCPIFFQGHPSNFKVTWDKTSPILTQIGRFPTIGRSQLSNPSDLPCLYWLDVKLGAASILRDWWWSCSLHWRISLIAPRGVNSLRLSGISVYAGTCFFVVEVGTCCLFCIRPSCVNQGWRSIDAKKCFVKLKHFYWRLSKYLYELSHFSWT